MEEHYKVTAMGWDNWPNSPTPPQLAEAMSKIHKFATIGAPQELLQTCEQLFFNNKNPTLQACALNLLSHLVSKRWEDLSDEDKQSIFSALPKFIGGVALVSAWSTKNKMAIVLSQLIEKKGAETWAETWAKLVSASAAHLSCDDIKAERTIVTCLSEGITIPGDNFEVDKRMTDDKNQNWDWLTEALFSLILKHVANSDPSKVAAAQQHYDFALSLANTASVYAEWGEVKNLVKSVGGTNLINSWKVLLSYDAFSPATFAYLSKICSRVQPTDGCDHGVLMDIFYLLFDQLKTLPLDLLHSAFGFRKTVCSSLVSIKESLGPDFENLGKGVSSLLEGLKANGSVTDTEYCLGRSYVVTSLDSGSEA